MNRNLPLAPAAPLPTATTFCEARVTLWAGCTLYVDGNSKITASNGTYEKPSPNALSLPAASVEGADAGACPGSTPTCRDSCYVRGLAQHAPDLYARYGANAEAIAMILGERPSWGVSAAFAFASWIKLNARGGFRWHVSGDVWSVAHAQWIAQVCAFTPSTLRHWIYTRTLEAVPALTAADNLAVNVSADIDNYAEARAVARETGARLCYMTSKSGYVPHDLPPGSVIFPNYPQRGHSLPDPTEHAWWGERTQAQKSMVCPADFFGQSEAHRCGPCAKCLVRAKADA